MNKFFTLIILLSGFLMTAQVGIGTAIPDPAAALDINSELPDGTYGGLKLPTINEADKSSIATPIPDGLMLYVIDGLERCVEIYDANTSSWVTFYCMNLVPVATNVNVLDDGTPQITETLTTDFDETSASFQTDNENDAPQTPEYQWYRADDAAGLNEVAIAAPEGIAATYTLVAADNDKFIRLGIRPTASAGASPGIEVFSAYTTQIDYLPTIVEFDRQFSTIGEDTIPDDIDLVFEFPNVSSTDVMVTVSSSDYTRLDETGPVTITIPANQTSPFTTTVFNVDDNASVDGTASLTFTITNVTGGLGSNSIGTDDTDLWDITDDDGVIVFLINEDFETDGNGSRYTESESQTSNDAFDYYTRTNGTTPYSISAVFTNEDGFYFAAQDIDDAPGIGDATQELTFNSITTSGQTTFTYSIDLAEDVAFDNAEDWDALDFFHIQYRLDGAGAWTTFFAIENDGIGTGLGSNSAPFVDTDLDGDGDGTEVTDTFQTFSGSLTTAAHTSIEFRFAFSLNAGDEDIAVDNFTIQ